MATSDSSAESGDSNSLEVRPTQPVDLIPFREALNLAQGGGKKHLMLGNGFSIALRPEIFTYNTLFERAKESRKLTDALQGVFAKLDTTDFEKVIEALKNAAELVSLYKESNPGLAEQLQQDAERLRGVLAETIAEHHPSRPHEIRRQQYASCRRFLSNFDGHIYTLNYDLLLYWTLMKSEVPPTSSPTTGSATPRTTTRNTSSGIARTPTSSGSSSSTGPCTSTTPGRSCSSSPGARRTSRSSIRSGLR